tara:strand:+ start:272 stop:514 length:243 start_codon:yes stop_codon:yes gene_type:complete
MSTTLKISVQEDIKALYGQPFIHHSRSQNQDVCVIMPSSQFSYIRTATNGGANTRSPIENNTHADARPTDGNPAGRLSSN